MTLMLIGNKTDLAKMREVQTEDAANYAEREQMALIETSALDSSNVNTAFECIIKGKYLDLAVIIRRLSFPVQRFTSLTLLSQGPKKML